MGAWLAASLATVAAHHAWAAAYVPTSDDVVLEQLPFRARSAAGQQLADLRRAHQQAPGDPAPASALANRGPGAQEIVEYAPHP